MLFPRWKWHERLRQAPSTQRFRLIEMRSGSASPASKPRRYGRGITWPQDLQVRCASLSKKRA